MSFLLVLSESGFGARPLCPPVTLLTASLNFLTDVVVRWPTGLVTGPPGDAALGVWGLVSAAVAVRTVLLWPLVAAGLAGDAALGVWGLVSVALAVLAVLLGPLVAAGPPKGLLLIAMPGVVCVTVRPS